MKIGEEIRMESMLSEMNSSYYLRPTKAKYLIFGRAYRTY